MNRVGLWSVVVAGAASRLVLACYPPIPLSHDECVVGLMGKHLADGHGTSLYFYGQWYGLSIVEAGAAALAYSVFDVTALGLRIGMLGLLAVAGLLLYVALSRIAGRRAALFGVALLLTIPPWTLWSLQARGGYITALLGSCAMLAGVASLRQRPSWLGWLGVAAAAAITLMARASWLVAVLPVLLLVPLRRRDVLLGATLLSLVLLFCAVGHVVGMSLTTDHWQPPSIGVEHIKPNLSLLSSTLTEHFTTDMLTSGERNLSYVLCGWIWMLGLGFGLGVQVWRIATRRFHAWSHALCASTVGGLASLMVLPLLPRYMMSVSFFLVVWLVVECAALPGRRFWAALAVCAIGLGLSGLAVTIHQGTGRIQEDEIMRLVEVLEDAGTHHAYSLTGDLQWIVMFYSQESVLTRWTFPNDRLPAVRRAVDRALYAGMPVALISRTDSNGGSTPGAIPGIPFSFVPGPTPAELNAHGFHLHSP